MLRETSLLIGRSTELNALVEHWQQGSRLISIHGLPGMGKRRLALAFLERVLPGRFAVVTKDAPRPKADGILLEHSPSLDLSALDRDDQSATKNGKNSGHSRTVVLLSEHQNVCPAGLQLELGPLAPKDALLLYETRSGRRLREDGPALVEALGGWPIAIQRAAKQARLRTERALLDEGERLPEVLGLAALLQGVVDKLAPGPRRLLLALCQLSAGFDLEMAEVLYGAGAQDALSALRDGSLVREVEASRDRILLCVPALLRSFVRKLRGTLPEPRLLNWAEKLVSAAEEQSRLFYSAPPEAPSAWLRNYLPDLTVLSRDKKIPAKLSARAALAIEPLITTSGSMGSSIATLERAYGHAEESGDEGLLAHARWALGKAWVTRSYFDRSENWTRGAEPLASRIDSVDLAAHIFICLGHSVAWHGRLEESRAYINEALTWAKDAGEDYARTLAEIQFAFLAMHEGNYKEAVRLAESVKREASYLAFPRIVGLSRTIEGWALGLDERYQPAINALDHAARIMGRMGETSQMLMVWSLTIAAWGHLGEIQRAEALCKKGLEIAKKTEDDERALLLLTELAELYTRAEQPERAQSVLSEAGALSRMVIAPDLIERQRSMSSLLPGRPDLRVSKIVLDRGAKWFDCTEGRVALSRRASVRRILMRLIEGRLDSPNVPIEAELLFAAGWPGRALGPRTTGSVYTAVWTLRKLGLKDALVTSERGYHLLAEATSIKG